MLRNTEPEESLKSAWCLIGNVSEITLHGPGGAETRKGTRHFPPGTKVYCCPPLWGDGYENIQVVGRRRGSHRYVSLVMPSRHITNWRAAVVYSPAVLHRLARYQMWESESEVQTAVRSLQTGRVQQNYVGPTARKREKPWWKFW